MTHDEFQKLCDDLMREANKRGQTVEVGWLSLRKVWLHPDSPESQVKENRMAFFAGALHLFSTIMRIMDEDREPTDNDMRIMQSIDKELRDFGKIAEAMATAAMPTEGSA